MCASDACGAYDCLLGGNGRACHRVQRKQDRRGNALRGDAASHRLLQAQQGRARHRQFNGEVPGNGRRYSAQHPRPRVSKSPKPAVTAVIK